MAEKKPDAAALLKQMKILMSFVDKQSAPTVIINKFNSNTVDAVSTSVNWVSLSC